MIKLRVFLGLALLISAALVTAESSDTNAASQNVLDKGSVELIKKRVKDELQAEATSIKQTPVKGLYEVTVPPRVFYISANGQYVLTGDMIDLKNSANLSQDVRDEARIASIENLGEKNMIVFAPKKVKHTVTVFTDIDCGYCRKLHSEIGKYNALGIEVRYLAYPRAGIGSPSYQKAVNVWCSADKKKALTDAKQGKNLPVKNCENPVAKEYELGQALGVNGTPAIVLENGQIYPGYAPADRLFKVLEHVQNQAKK
ncbi:MAG: DsbC family protein [Thioalkalispiraceae bacterium]|jgi:thiol:disulfide interchange protein DsbC